MRPGTIGITCLETARYTVFTASLAGLDVPEGSQIVWGMGLDVAGNRNYICEQLRPEDEWLFFVDDDAVFKSDVLMRLLAHDVDVVAALYLRKMRPFPPQAFVDDAYSPVDLATCPTSGLAEVWAAGTSGMLIRRRVLDSIEPPWFQNWNLGDDAWFCRRLRDQGIPIHVDLDARMGHLSTVAIWPSVVEDGWVTRFVVADGHRIDEAPYTEVTSVEPEPLPMLTGYGSLISRPPVRPRSDDPPIEPIGEENGQPVFAVPPGEGPAIPTHCMRRLGAFRPMDCQMECEGRQRDGSCLVDVIRECVAEGVDWTARGVFELDKDRFWTYKGPALERV